MSLDRDGFLLPAGLVNHGSKTRSPDWGLCLGFPSHQPSACTCNPDCFRLEARPFLEMELSVGAAQEDETGGGEGASRVPRRPRLSQERWVEQLHFVRCKSNRCRSRYLLSIAP
jgi:hypothetical protein